MSSKWRRFEVLLPLQFNDGREVPADWLAEAVLEVVESVARRRRARRMGVQTDVVIADLDDAQAIAETATPTAEWQGFTFNGFDHVQACTLLSLLKAGRPDAEFQRYLGAVEPVAVGGEEGPVVVGVRPEQVAELAAVAGLDEAEFKALASAWAATEEFAGWSASDVRELLRELGDLAESASLQGKCLLMWQSL